MNKINMCGASFKGKYIIPYSQLNNPDAMQKISQASSQYITDPNQLEEVPEGIVVNIDDKREKEYEAMIAKYGANIQKYDKTKSVNKNVSFNGNPQEKVSGNFADKLFEIDYDRTLNNRAISGKIDNECFFIKHKGKMFSDDIINGQIGDKELNLKSEDGFGGSTISGTIGNEPIILQLNRKLTGEYLLKGQYKNKNISIKINNKLQGLKIEGDNVSLKTKDANLFNNNVKIDGIYENDPDLIPILMDIIYSIHEERTNEMLDAIIVPLILI